VSSRFDPTTPLGALAHPLFIDGSVPRTAAEACGFEVPSPEYQDALMRIGRALADLFPELSPEEAGT